MVGVSLSKLNISSRYWVDCSEELRSEWLTDHNMALGHTRIVREVQSREVRMHSCTWHVYCNVMLLLLTFSVQRRAPVSALVHSYTSLSTCSIVTFPRLG